MLDKILLLEDDQSETGVVNTWGLSFGKDGALSTVMSLNKLQDIPLKLDTSLQAAGGLHLSCIAFLSLEQALK